MNLNILVLRCIIWLGINLKTAWPSVLASFSLLRFYLCSLKHQRKTIRLHVRLRELATFIFNGAFPEVQPQKFYYHVADLAKNNVEIGTKHGKVKAKLCPDTFCFKFIPVVPRAPVDLSDE